jgi:hypothetical protein
VNGHIQWCLGGPVEHNVEKLLRSDLRALQKTSLQNGVLLPAFGAPPPVTGQIPWFFIKPARMLAWHATQFLV